ncbi:MAG: DMT family transporter [Methanobrevibacter sp.]|uniref:DMT family transporter n=1 Tax=Methanobrevibacter sp. TaxID=66852 RepID=UPI0025E718B9|nr:DMT family transporter [Methanobrevibacter sp.]MBR0272434.1 DMT family transporter [Methanobrevibacter sp.]
MKKLYLILPILSGILFGSSGIFVRTLTQNGIDATTLLFLRFSIAIIILLIAILATNRNLIRIKINDLKLFIITALCIVGLNLFYNTSMNTVPLSLAAVLLSSAPVFVIIFAYILFREKITLTKVISIILVIIGCILTTGLLEGNYANVSAIGIFGGVVAAIFWAMYTVASKKALEEEIHTYTILFYSLIILTLILLPFTNFGQITSFVNSNIAFNILFLILHSTFSFALPYILLTVSLNHIDSGSASIFTSGAEPLAALCFGMIIYSEIPTALTFIGVVLTILALIILSKNEKE